MSECAGRHISLSYLFFSFTPLEKIHPVRRLLLTGQAGEIDGDIPYKTDGDLNPLLAYTDRKFYSLTGFISFLKTLSRIPLINLGESMSPNILANSTDSLMLTRGGISSA